MHVFLVVFFFFPLYFFLYFFLYLYIYIEGFPLQSNRMLVMEANQEPRNEVFATSPSLIDYQADKPGLDKKDIDQWSDGGVVDGRVVCFPDRSHNILIWEDNQDCNETFAGIDIPSDVAVKNTPQFQNFAVLNGKFYAAPHSAEHILIYDEVNGAIKSSSEKVPNDYKTGDDDQWSGTVAISGKVYGVPSSSKFVLIYSHHRLAGNLRRHPWRQIVVVKRRGVGR